MSWIDIDVVSISFGPYGADGKGYNMPINGLVKIDTTVSTSAEANIYVPLPNNLNLDTDLRSALGLDIAVTTVPKLDVAAVLITTNKEDYLFPYCQIYNDGFDFPTVRFEVKIDPNLHDDDGGEGCRLVKNGSKRPLKERMHIA